jgi:hypothetical protein
VSAVTDYSRFVKKKSQWLNQSGFEADHNWLFRHEVVIEKSQNDLLTLF